MNINHYGAVDTHAWLGSKIKINCPQVLGQMNGKGYAEGFMVLLG